MTATPVYARRFVSLVKLEHTVFALPYAYAGAVLAAGEVPGIQLLAWITVAMVGARSLAMALNAMGDQFRSLLDVTIVYPDGTPTFWQFMCGRCSRVVVRVRQLEISPELRLGDYTTDTAFRRHFHQWLDTVWQEKDAQIEALLQGESTASRLALPAAVQT